MVESIYIETTIPSFYHEVRGSSDMIARRDWTKDWWDNFSQKYQLYTSEAVIDELEKGDFPIKDQALSLLSELPLLQINEAVIETVEVYIAHRIMPADPVGDALHLAIASVHKCDYLLTWNCKHIANANEFAHI